MLSIEYGFCDEIVCEKYYNFRIEEFSSIEEYAYFRDVLNCAINGIVENNKEEHTITIYKLGKEQLEKLKVVLNARFEKLYLENIKKELKDVMSNDNWNWIQSLIKNDFDYFIKIAVLFEKFNILCKSTELIDSIENIHFYIFKNIKSEDIVRFSPYFACRIYELIRIIKNGEISENKMDCIIEFVQDFPKWISEKTKAEIQNMGEDFLKSTNHYTLRFAYSYGIISETQYFERFISLTLNYKGTDWDSIIIEKFGNPYFCFYPEDFPTAINIYIIRKFIEGFDIIDFASEFKKVIYKDGGYIHIHNLQTLLNFLIENEYLYNEISVYIVEKLSTSAIDNFKTLRQILKKNKIDYHGICNNIILIRNIEDRFILFELGLCSYLPNEDIRIELDIQYEKDHMQWKLFDEAMPMYKMECFQKMMVKDVLHTNEMRLIVKIISLLDSEYIAVTQKCCDEKVKFGIWANTPNTAVNWTYFKQYFAELPELTQINVFKYLFYLKSINIIDFSIENLLPRLKSTEKGTYKISDTIYLICYILNKKVIDSSYHFSGEGKEMLYIKESSYLCMKYLPEFFDVCKGYLRLASDLESREEAQSCGYIKKIKENNEEVYYVHIYKNMPKDSFEIAELATGILEENIPIIKKCENFVVSSKYEQQIKKFQSDFRIAQVQEFGKASCTSNYIQEYESEGNRLFLVHLCKEIRNVYTKEEIDVDKNKIIKTMEESLPPYEQCGSYYLINPKYEEQIKDFVIAFHITEDCELFKYDWDWGSHDSPIKNFFTNVSYDTFNKFCRCGNSRDFSPENKIPFYWCNKKPCVTQHFLSPQHMWKRYRFVDLLYILWERDLSRKGEIWNVNAEIVNYLHQFMEINNNCIQSSRQINNEEEIGTWEDSTIFDDYDDEYTSDEDYYNNIEPPTYDRYKGSYAQDEMGYSDDDIDTIFDGDPDAYWNID